MMSHWELVLPLPMLEVAYEDVVSDIDRQARRMLEFLEIAVGGKVSSIPR